MNYRETVRSVRSFLGWSHIPDFEASASDADNRSDNPWKGKHPRRSGKVSVELPADDWLCYKMEKLNTRVAEGYPSRSQEAAGLKQDQFIRTPKSQAKWYTQSRLKQDINQRPGRTIFGWSGSEARLNSQFSRIAKSSSYPSSGPASRPIPQEILRRWEQCAKEGSLITNHAAGFNRCVSEIQDKMNQHISFLNATIVQGKAPKEVTDAIKDLKDLSAFHSSVSVALGTTFQHLADSLFVQLANFILLRRDSYLEYVKPGLKPDTWNKLRNAPLFTYGLFPDDVLAVAEQDIQKHDSNKSATGPGPGTYQHSKKHQFRYQRVVNPASPLPKINNLGGNSRAEAGVGVVVEVDLVLHTTPSLPVVPNHINDNQYLLSPPVVLSSSLGDLNLVSSANKETFPETVNLHVVLPAPSVKGLLQKKNVRPSHSQIEIKSVNSALSVNQCLFAPNVTNAPCVAKDPPVGGRLQLFWQVWLSLGSNPRVVSILREGYQLPFKERPPLARFPVIISGSSNPSQNKSLNEALHSLGQKQTIEKVSVQSSLGFYNRLFLVPKPNGKWRPILDLSQLNLYLAPATFKMETPETIRLSLQQGEWVTSLDFSDAYFHIPINHRSRKYLRFHLKGQTFQFTALPFGLSTAPLEFTKVVKEVKLMAQSRGIRIHQYLDDWLLRAPCREICLRHTQILLDLCRSLGWVVNMDKSELVPQQTFDFVGYHFDLSQG